MARLIKTKISPHGYIFDKKLSTIFPKKVISMSEICVNKNSLFNRDEKTKNIHGLIRSFIAEKEVVKSLSHDRSNRHQRARVVRDVLVFFVQYYANLKQEIELVKNIAKSIAENVCKGPVSFGLDDFDGVVENSIREYFGICILVSQEKVDYLNHSFCSLVSVFGGNQLFASGGENNQASLNLIFSEMMLRLTFDERDLEKILMALKRTITCSNNLEPNEKIA